MPVQKCLFYSIRQDSGGPVRGHRRINICWGTAIVHLMSLSPGALSLRGVMTLTTRQSQETGSSHPAKKKIQVKVSGASDRNVTGTWQHKAALYDTSCTLHHRDARRQAPDKMGSQFWSYPFPSFFFASIYKTRRRTSYKDTSKYGISPLLHVPARLCHSQEVHTPNHKVRHPRCVQ